jgi:hypothetical protein
MVTINYLQRCAAYEDDLLDDAINSYKQPLEDTQQKAASTRIALH